MWCSTGDLTRDLAICLFFFIRVKVSLALEKNKVAPSNGKSSTFCLASSGSVVDLNQCLNAVVVTLISRLDRAFLHVVPW